MNSSSATLSEPLTRKSSTESRPLLPLLVLLFVCSGCSALIYEIVWFQLLALVVGSTGVSIGVLLGTFMGGMCLGSLLLPRLVSPRWHPLLVYGLLELGIGIVGVGVLTFMPRIAEAYTNFPTHGILVRALVGVICLLPPTLLMGATLPAIARWVQTSRDGVSWLGFFYGGNIAGAVFGCLLAGFYLLRVYDMRTATYVAAALNGAVALAGIFLALTTRYRANRPSRNDEDNSDLVPPGSKLVYFVAAMSGLTGLGAEVVWTRLLALMIGQTVYTFSIILSVFLFGLGIGSTIGALIARVANKPRMALAGCQILLAGAIVWAAFAISDSMPFWPIDTKMASDKPWLMFQLDLVRCMWAVLPGAILWGASFPLALASVSARGQDSGRLVGGVYAVNTAGAIIGALMFAMVLIPRIGTHNSERVLIGLCFISGAVALVALMLEDAEWSTVGRLVTAGIVGTVAGGLAVWSIVKAKPMPWEAVAFGRHSAMWSSHTLPGVLTSDGQGGVLPSALADAKADVMHDWYCLKVFEGMNVSAAVTESHEGYRYFHGAGKVQASTDPKDMRLQRMLGHISALTFRNHDPESVLVVACGAGVTAGSFIPYDSVKRIVICDIEPVVPQQVTPMFGEANYHIVDGIAKQNPHKVDGKQVEVKYDDGRHFVRTTHEKFDVITSDPIDPWVKGCAALNTVEYYTMCKEHLNPGGVMALWIPFYESNEDTVKSVLGTFFKVFPNGIVWSNDNWAGGYDAVLFGQVDGTKVNLDETDAWIDAHPKVKQSLLDVGFGAGKATGNGPGVAVDLFASFAGLATHLTQWNNRPDLINYDSNLRLQYLAGMWLNSRKSDDIFNGILAHYSFPSEIFSGSPEQISALKQALASTGRIEKMQSVTAK